MTEPSEPDQAVAAAIRALRHDILSNSRNMSWDDVRGWIRGLIRHGRPSFEERIELLELYHLAVTMVQRRLRPDPVASRRLEYQRANDAVMFLVSEIRDHGAADASDMIATITERELAAGRMRVDEAFDNVISWVLQDWEDRVDQGPGVAEESVAFAYPAALNRPPSSLSFPPGP